MWERKRINRYKREILAIGKAVTDPDDIAVILELEEQFRAVKAIAARKLIDAGYSQREVARGAVRSLNAVQQWIKLYPEDQELLEESPDDADDTSED